MFYFVKLEKRQVYKQNNKLTFNPGLALIDLWSTQPRGLYTRQFGRWNDNLIAAPIHHQQLWTAVLICSFGARHEYSVTDDEPAHPKVIYKYQNKNNRMWDIPQGCLYAYIIKKMICLCTKKFALMIVISPDQTSWCRDNVK